MTEQEIEDIMRWHALRTRLRTRRKGLGLTQQELSARMGRSPNYISVLENSTRSIPKLETLWLWADALGMPVSVGGVDS